MSPRVSPWICFWSREHPGLVDGKHILTPGLRVGPGIQGGGTIIILAILALYLNAIKLLSGQKLWLSVCKLSYCLIIVLWRFICLIALIYYIGFGRHWLYGGLAFSSGLLIVLTGFGIRYHLQKRQLLVVSCLLGKTYMLKLLV